MEKCSVDPQTVGSGIVAKGDGLIRFVFTHLFHLLRKETPTGQFSLRKVQSNLRGEDLWRCLSLRWPSCPHRPWRRSSSDERLSSPRLQRRMTNGWKRRERRTRRRVTGYSVKADATAFAPAMFVVFDRPTKNSRPEEETSNGNH